MAGVNLGGLWEKKAANGDVYYEGNFGFAIIRVYNNKYKKAEKDPDCVMYISERPKAGAQQGVRPGPPFKPKVTPRPQAPQRTTERPQIDTESKGFADEELPWPTSDDEIPY